MLQRFHPILWLILAVAGIAAGHTLFQRHQTEGRSRAVALVLDMAQVRALATAGGVPVDEALRRLRAAGATGVAITEETLADLESAGLIEVDALDNAGGREFHLGVPDSGLADRIALQASRRTRGASTSVPTGDRVAAPASKGTVYIPGRWEELRATPVGLDPADVALVRAAGLDVVGRIGNTLSLTPEGLRWELGQLREMGIDVVIFSGEEVLGHRGLTRLTAETFEALDLRYGSVEFGKQRGDEALSSAIPSRVVRVHSISPGEMARLAPHEAIERYVRAASERNIRLCYVRLPVAVTESTFDEATSYLKKVARGMVAARFGLSAPRPLGDVWPDPLVGRFHRVAVAAGVGAALVLLLACLLPIPRKRQAFLGLLAALGAGLVAASGVVMGTQLLALAAAVLFPTLAFALRPAPVGAYADPQHPDHDAFPPGFLSSLRVFGQWSLVTLVGAVFVAVLLSQLPFLIKIKSFIGIKASTVLPLLLIGGMCLLGPSGRYPDGSTARDAVRDRLRRFLSQPLLVWHTVVVMAGIVVLALVVARSGNDPGIGVSDLELRFRALLDRLLGVRPRTKEFLIGHPALLVGLLLASRPAWRGWALPLILVGFIGQTGMLNSFCHLHTPIKLTLLRTFHGIWAGLLIGGAAAVALGWLIARCCPPRLPGSDASEDAHG